MKTPSPEAVEEFQRQRAELCQECITLVFEIARRPACLKLLPHAKEALSLLAGYKQGRDSFKNRRESESV